MLCRLERTMDSLDTPVCFHCLRVLCEAGRSLWPTNMKERTAANSSQLISQTRQNELLPLNIWRFSSAEDDWSAGEMALRPT
jgi:hypothetical protein